MKSMAWTGCVIRGDGKGREKGGRPAMTLVTGACDGHHTERTFEQMSLRARLLGCKSGLPQAIGRARCLLLLCVRPWLIPLECRPETPNAVAQAFPEFR